METLFVHRTPAVSCSPKTRANSTRGVQNSMTASLLSHATKKRTRLGEPAALHMTSVSNMDKCANTQLCLWSHTPPSAERGVRESLLRAKEEEGGGGRGRGHGRDMCVREGRHGCLLLCQGERCAEEFGAGEVWRVCNCFFGGAGSRSACEQVCMKDAHLQPMK